MKNTFAVAAFSLLTSALAAPYNAPPPSWKASHTPSDTPANPSIQFDRITFIVKNAYAGTTGVNSVVADGSVSTFSHLFANTKLAKHGRVFATNAELVTLIDGVLCIISSPAGEVITININKPQVDLDGNAHQDVETDVSDFTLTCEQ